MSWDRLLGGVEFTGSRDDKSPMLIGALWAAGLMFDAMGQPRTRYVRVSLAGNQCVMHPSEGDTYLQDARDCGDESSYIVADVYLSEREFEDLPEHDGF